VAPNSIASPFFASLVKATTSQPQALRNIRARWPKPPMPTTPTRSVGFTSNCNSGLKTVVPPQNSGPGLGCVDRFRQRQNPRRLSADAVRKAAVAADDRLLDGGAQVEIAAETGPAHETTAGKPSESDALADGDGFHIVADGGHLADHFMPADERVSRHSQVVIQKGEIAVAEAA